MASPRYNRFNKFYLDRLSKRPYDLESNKNGFPVEDKNPDNSSDIAAHLPILQYFASQSRHVTEFGTRNACSTSALISGVGQNYPNGVVVSYDMCTTDAIFDLINMEKNGLLPCAWKFVQRNTLSDFQIDPTEFLFIDTYHNYNTVKGELEKHGSQTTRFLGFHDTWSKGQIGDNGKEEGITRAIQEYCRANKFKCVLCLWYNHGLEIWERK